MELGEKSASDANEKESISSASNNPEQIDSPLQNETKKRENNVNPIDYSLGPSSYQGNNTKSQTSDNQNRQKPSSMMSNLALRLAASGLPIVSSSSSKSIDTILKSLTKTEGVNARFLCITPSTLLRKYVGETNLNIRALFSMARKISPCIIFIDEMEGLFKERSSGGGTGDELLTELKTEFMQLWDGIHSRGLEDEQISIIGATNRPFDVDSAFLRRMPHSFFVGLPSLQSRLEILKRMLSRVPLSDSFDVESLATATDNYSPSDLKEVLRTAALNPLREARRLAIQRQSMGQTRQMKLPHLRPLTTSDVMEAREKVAPTQLSASYRIALADHAHRASGGRAKLNGLSSAASNQYNEAYQHHSPTNAESTSGQILYTNFHSTEMPEYNSQASFEEYDTTDDYDDSSSYD